MVVSSITVQGSQMVQQDMGYDNFVFSDQEGVLYSPDPNITQPQPGFFYYTAAPPVLNNFAWNLIKLNWSRSYDTTLPDNFQALITLEGILLNGQVELLGEKVIETLTSSPVTEDITFDLRSNRSAPSLTKLSTGLGTAGKVQVNLPKRWINFTDITLKRAWMAGWLRRKKQPVTGGSLDLVSYPIKITLTYDADMKSDFSDVRFATNDGRTPLCAYLHSYTASTSAVFYVLYPNSIESRDIYIYYGNSSATLASNIANVFTLGDDFNDNSIDTTKWAVVNEGGGSIAETNQEIQVTSDGTNRVYLKSKDTFTSPYVFEFKAKKGENIEVAFNWDGAYNNAIYDQIMNGYFFWYSSWESLTQFELFKAVGGSITRLDSYDISLDGNYHNYEVKCYKSGANVVIEVYYDNTLILNFTDSTTPFTSGSLGFSAVQSPAALNAYYGAIRAYSYDPTPPAPGIIGSEESTISVDPATPTEEDTSLLYTLPGDWSGAEPIYLESTEVNHTPYDTNDLIVSAKDILDFGYNSVDKYMGMRIGVQILGDVNTNVRFNSLDYAYEVI